jgi:hypothetical protein
MSPFSPRVDIPTAANKCRLFKGKAGIVRLLAACGLF